MKLQHLAIMLGLGVGFIQPALAANEGELGEGMVNPGYHEPPPWFKASFLDLGEDVREAAAAGKRLMVYFYQDGCPYCKKLLDDNFGQPAITAKTRKHFDVVSINMWGDREVTALDGRSMTEKELSAQLKVMFTPTLLFLDEAGEVVLRVNGYYAPDKFDAALDYVREKHEKRISFRDYYRDRAASAPAAAARTARANPHFLAPPYDLAKTRKASNKPLLVVFEQTQCEACEEFHNDILARKETQKFLKKFDAALLDMWSDTPLVTAKGTKSTARQWAKDLDVKHVPSLVFFDKTGAEVFRTEGYLRSFHIQSVMDYVASGAYLEEPSLQRFLQARADAMRAQGIEVDLMD